MRRLAVLAAGSLLAVSIAGCAEAIPQAQSTTPTPTPKPAGDSAEPFPTSRQLRKSIAPDELIGRWSVSGPGVLPDTYVTFDENLKLDQACGPLWGAWIASDRGRVSFSLQNAGPTCLSGGGRNWTQTATGQQSWGEKVVLTQIDGQPDVVLTPAPVTANAPTAAMRKTLMRTWFPPGPPLPSNLLAVDAVDDEWFVRQGMKGKLSRGVDGVQVTGWSDGAAHLYGYGYSAVLTRATGISADAKGRCLDATRFTVLTNKDGSWVGPLPPEPTAGVGGCERFTGPALTGADPVDSLKRAAGGGIDPDTGQLVLFNAKGRVIQRLDSLDPLLVHTESEILPPSGVAS